MASSDALALDNMTSSPYAADINSTTYLPPETLWLNEVTNAIRTTYLWVIFALGFPGNIMCIITVVTMHAMTPAIFYVATLAFCDAIVLLAKLIGMILFNNEVVIGNAGCKAQFIIPYISTVANWILVLICAERFVSVCFPLQKAFIVTMKRTYCSVAVLCASLLVLIAPFFLLMRGVFPNGYKCGTEEVFYDVWSKAYLKIASSFYLFIPFICIVVFTSLIIRGLIQHRRHRRMMMTSGHADMSSDSNNLRLLTDAERVEKSITAMLVVAALLFLVLSLPRCVYVLVHDPLDAPNKTPHEFAQWMLFQQIGFLCLDFTHAVNFFIYFFSAQRFRHQLFRLVVRGKTCRVCCVHSENTQYSLASQCTQSNSV